MKQAKFLISLSATVLLGACSSFYEPERVSSKNSNYELFAKHALTFEDKTPNVYKFNAFYVPELAEEDKKVAAWAEKRVNQKLSTESKLGFLLDSVIGEQLINVELREGVDTEKLIVLPNLAEELTIKELLTLISASTGYKIDIRENSLVINKYVTQIFPVRAPVGLYEFAIGKKVESQSSGDSDDFAKADALLATGDEFATLKGEFDPLSDYLSGVESILSCKSNEELSRLKSALDKESATDDLDANSINDKSAAIFKCESGASAKIIKSDSSIFVKALPSQIVEVEKFIKKKTERDLRQVRVDLTLVAVEKNNDTAFNFDADLIDKTLAGIDKLAIETISKSSSGVIGGLGDRGVSKLSHINGTSLLLESLAKHGSILDKTYMIASASNNRIGKFTDSSKISLITDRPVNSSSNFADNANFENGVEQKVVSSGRVFYMLPNIGESDVVLSVSTSLSSLKDIVQKGGKGSEVESPEISDREINTTVRLEPNRPKIIGGFSIDESQSLFSSTGLTGIGRSSRDRQVHVVMVAEVRMD